MYKSRSTAQCYRSKTYSWTSGLWYTICEPTKQLSLLNCHCNWVALNNLDEQKGGNILDKVNNFLAIFKSSL